MERLKDEFAATSDPARQKQIAEQMQRLAYEEVFAIPLGSYKVLTGHSSAVRDVIADQLLAFWNLRYS